MALGNPIVESISTLRRDVNSLLETRTSAHPLALSPPETPDPIQTTTTHAKECTILHASRRAVGAD